jgi:hypothetical protein
MRSPDIALTGNYQLQARPGVLAAILGEPIHLMRLWKAYGFSPRYRARSLQGQGLHVDDPTGISAEIFPVGSSGSRWVFMASGTVNHRLVPSLKGTAALVVTAEPSDSGLGLRVDLYLRMDNRFVGFLTKTFAPFLRGAIMNRIGYNLADIGTILGDLSARPRETAARLGAEDSAALLRLLAL